MVEVGLTFTGFDWVVDIYLYLYNRFTRKARDICNTSWEKVSFVSPDRI